MVISGMLKASHSETNRAAFSLALMSSTPALARGWLATMPTTCPSIRARAHTTLAAQVGCVSKYSPWSTISSTTSRTS